MQTSNEFNLASCLYSEAIDCSSSEKERLLAEATALIDKAILDEMNTIEKLKCDMDRATGEEKKRLAEEVDNAEEWLKKYRLLQRDIGREMETIRKNLPG